jgi:hypothetical protein
VAQKDGEKIEELEQTLIELGGEISAGRHVSPDVYVLLLCRLGLGGPALSRAR